MYKSIIAIVTSFGLALGVAASASASDALLAGDPERGKTLTTTCQACHGPDGKSPTDAFPSLAGQHEKYLLKQMQDQLAGDRVIAVMTGLLDNYSEQDLVDIAAYYASQKAQQGAADPETVELGEQIYRAGIPRKQIAACSACHSPTGSGNNFAKFPQLAGQWPAYTVSQLKMFRTGERHNDGESRMMRAIAMDMSDEEIEAVANYIYGLR